jgi:hypothetical protein
MVCYIYVPGTFIPDNKLFESWDEQFFLDLMERHRIFSRVSLESNMPHATGEGLLNEGRNDRKGDASSIGYMYVRRLSKYKKYLLNRTRKKTGTQFSSNHLQWNESKERLVKVEDYNFGLQVLFVV